MLMLLATQLLQMQTYKHQKFFINALDLLEDAWDDVDVDPNAMQAVEINVSALYYIFRIFIYIIILFYIFYICNF